MDFASYLRFSAGQIDRGIEIFFKEWVKEVKKVSPQIMPLVAAFIDACHGGKRLRGTLIKLGYELTGAEYTPEILKPAIGYELFNTAILAHDDIADLSPLRRNRPSLYMALGGRHYGMSQAMNLGDIGLFLPIKLITESNFPDTRKTQALSLLTKDVIETALGQILDVELSAKSSARREKDVITIASLKSALYTISGPLQIGAILGGANKALLRNLEIFGHGLGIAFQIQDDILGVFGDEKTIGKSVTSDIEEGKNTLLITHALKHASPSQRKTLDKYYGKGKVGKKELESIKQVFVESGALEYSRARMVQYVTQAKAIIPRITRNKNHARLLTEMADFLVERNK